jgi:hypothetical protein
MPALLRVIMIVGQVSIFISQMAALVFEISSM